jgi:hypothetical protein
LGIYHYADEIPVSASWLIKQHLLTPAKRKHWFLVIIDAPQNLLHSDSDSDSDDSDEEDDDGTEDSDKESDNGTKNSNDSNKNSNEESNKSNVGDASKTEDDEATYYRENLT